MAKYRLKTESEIHAQIERIYESGKKGTGVSFRRYAKAVGHVLGQVYRQQRRFQGPPFVTNAYLIKG